MDVVELCKKYRNDGVVAIDLAGDELLNCEANPEHRSAYEVCVFKYNTKIVHVEAKKPPRVNGGDSKSVDSRYVLQTYFAYFNIKQ